MNQILSDDFLVEHLLVSLVEDLGDGDVTTTSVVDETQSARANIRAKETGVLAGRKLAGLTFELLHREFMQKQSNLEIEWKYPDGKKVNPGKVVAEIEGDVETILTGERVALNYLQQLSGVASLTHRFVEIADPYDVKIYDTRKTSPHHRNIQKYAVRCGGGNNHRVNLSEAVMIKDNHKELAGGLRPALQSLETDVPVVVEIHDETELEVLEDFDIDVIMLDNFDTSEVKQLVPRLPEGPEVEVSGGIDLNTVESYCQAGIDRVSVGALTHSPRSMDLSLELILDG